MNNGWQRVTKQEPCGVCGHKDWCCRGVEGWCCMRVESKRPLHNGGWFHPFNAKMPVRKPVKVEPPKPAPNFTALLKGWVAEPTRVARHAAQLGVTSAALCALGIKWADKHNAWAFPMRDGNGRIVGIRLRNECGDKWAVTGSRVGIFRPAQLNDRLIIVEGPTDTAACLSIGLSAVGRADCNSCGEIIVQTIRASKVREAVIVEDVDCKQRPDGTTWNPGHEGAEKLAGILPVPHYVIAPPAKDFREAVRNGFTANILESILAGTLRRKPARHDGHQASKEIGWDGA